MSSFSQLKAMRDKKHPAQHVEATQDVGEAGTGSSSSSGAKGQLKPGVMPVGVEVRTDETRGRGLYATKSYQAGMRIIATEPLQAVLSVRNLSSTCSGCLLTPREVGIKTGSLRTSKSCRDCGVLRYCSDECRSLDWEDHEAECRILQALRPDIPNDAVRALARILLARKRARTSKGKEPEWWDSIATLENHLSQLSASGGFEQLAGLARQLGQYLAHSVEGDVSREDLFSSFGFNSPGELLELCSSVNSFALTLPDVSPIGVAISPMLAMANHSCDPNAVVVFPNGGRSIDVIAIRDINPDEEILISYIDVSLPVERRRLELEATYKFKCECTLCRRDTEIRKPGYEGTVMDLRAAIWHRDCKRKVKGKASLPVGWESQETNRIRCTKCKERFDLKTADLLDPYQRAIALLEADAKGRDDLTPNALLFQLIPALHAILVPSSYPLLSLLRLQLLRVRPNTSSELAYLDRLYSIVVTSSSLVYPGNLPVLAILHAEWGQILTQTFEGEGQELVSGRMVKSIELLRKAYDLCQKSFGIDGGVEGKRVAEVLRGLEAEIQMARSTR